MLGDFGGFQQLFQGVVGGVVAERGGKAARHGDERGERGGLAGGFVFAGSDLFDAQPERAERMRIGSAGATLAMMVESAWSGSESPKTLMAPLSEKGRPIWPMPQATESSGTSW